MTKKADIEHSLKHIVKHNKRPLLNRAVTNITLRIKSVIVFPCIDYSTCLLNSTWQSQEQ